jgi:muramoyltetrapeptide carboxypeptidase
MRSKPEALRPGDTVGIFLPSSPVREPFRGQGLQALRDLGFCVREVADPLSGADFRSRPPQQAFDELRALFAAPDVKALWAGRGGYGANYLLPLLESLPDTNAKIVVASSDASYLLWYLLDRRRQVVFYGPMAYGGLASGHFDRDAVLAALTGDRGPLSFEGEVLCPGRARGLLTGGCLSNFASLLATPYRPEVRGRILLLEDVNERPYRLDRMLWQCEQAGVFQRVRALLLGEFPGCFLNDDEKKTFYGRWRERLSRLGIPVIYDLPFGHAERAEVLPLGVNAAIDTAVGGGRWQCASGVQR